MPLAAAEAARCEPYEAPRTNYGSRQANGLRSKLIDEQADMSFISLPSPLITR